MSLASSRVLVTGATGFLGAALSEKLASAGAHVRALVHTPHKAQALLDRADVEVVTGDITRADDMAAAVEGCDYVFHCAAALGGSLALQRQVNVTGTRNVAQAAARAGVARMVHVSSIAVYGYPDSGTVRESDPAQPSRSAYNTTKARAEDVLLQVARHEGLAYSIIRPAMIYGPNASFWTAAFFKLAQRRPTPFPGPGHGTSYPIFVDDVVDMMLILAQHPAAAGQAFNCAPDPSPSWRDFVGGYSRLAGHDRWLAIPTRPLWLLASLLEFCLLLRGDPHDLPDILRFGECHITYSMDKARALLGWEPQISLQEGQQRCIPYLQRQGLLD